MGALSSRWAVAGDAPLLLDLLRGMHAEVGRAPLDDAKALTSIAATARAGLARLIFEDAELVATFGLWRAQWWFSTEEAFFSQWFYVRPAARAGGALRLMLEDIADLVEEAQTPAYIHLYHSSARDQMRRNGRFRDIADELGVLPSGRILAFDPKE